MNILFIKHFFVGTRRYVLSVLLGDRSCLTISEVTHGQLVCKEIVVYIREEYVLSRMVRVEFEV